MPPDGQVGCRLHPLPMAASSWDIAFNQHQIIKWYGANDTARLTLETVNGPRIASKRASCYGMYSIRAQVAPNRGTISAFYVS